MDLETLKSKCLEKMNGFTIKYMNIGLDDDQLVRDQSKNRLQKLTNSDDVLNKYMIKYFWKYHPEEMSNGTIDAIMDDYSDYMIKNYLSELLQKYPKSVFRHFNAAYLSNPKQVEKYLRVKYGNSFDMNELIEELSLRSEF